MNRIIEMSIRSTYLVPASPTGMRWPLRASTTRVLVTRLPTDWPVGRRRPCAYSTVATQNPANTRTTPSTTMNDAGAEREQGEAGQAQHGQDDDVDDEPEESSAERRERRLERDAVADSR